jgi:hypothetical protein
MNGEGFSVRIAIGGVEMRGETVLLTRSGVVVRCEEPPAVDSVVVLDVYLPGNGKALEARALVRQRLQDGWLAGFRAQFIGLDPVVRDALAPHLSRTGGLLPVPVKTRIDGAQGSESA